MDIQDLPDDDALFAEQEELLALLLEEEGFSLSQTQTITPRAQTGAAPFLSFAQQRLWFLDQLEPDSPTYNFPIAVRLTGSLNITALEQSLGEIVRRHEVLRTTFDAVAGQPVQIINPWPVRDGPARWPIPVVDLGQGPSVGDNQGGTISPETVAREEAQRPFDLTQGPLLRARLLRLQATEHILLLTLHHIVFDGWSQDIFFQELGLLYEAFAAGKVSPLPELPIQYADFAQWQRQWLQGEVLETQLAYWRKQLSGKLPILQLPTDRPRPSVQTFSGATYTLSLPKRLTEALKALSDREGVTLFMTLLATFKTLLYRYTGQADILVGMPIANRTRSEIERLIGFFVNTLVLRTDLSGNPTYRELLGRVRETALGAYAHQDLPFERLVETLQPERTLSHQPIFQVMFALHTTPGETPALPELALSPVEVESGIAQFELSLFLEENERGLRASWEYNTDLFDETTITRMMGHWQTLLSSIIANPEQRLAELPLLTDAERQQMLLTWNETQLDYYEDLCFHQLFEAQVEQTPDAIAVIFEDRQLSYGELNRRANQLAHQLRTWGVGPETLVGICLRRSPEMIVALLGVLKAGGAYVPLDPTYPPERLAFMLADSHMPVLLTQAHLLPQLPEPPAQIICLDADRQTLATQPEKNPVSLVTPDNLAYVIYTSGSTGHPKGVQIPQRALSNFLNAMRRQPGLTDRDTLLAVTTLSFDIAALELFLPLTVGARLVIVSREVASDGQQLLEQLIQTGATVMQATPATWQLLLAAGWQEAHGLKILCGGQALPPALAQQLLERGAGLWNLYGPTETTIWSTIYQVEAVEGSAPIGRPIANTELYILDARLQPVPIGVTGDLYLGGHGLARGYLNRPDLTAERFIPHPFSQTSNARLYKTGDLARYRADGNLEFLGRVDHQVKIRGFRIELGEIEATLSQHPAIREAAALAWATERTPDDQRLAAYVVANRQPPPSNQELRNDLATKLPDYMLPSAFIWLEALPLTPNGKVDRQALPPLDQARSASVGKYTAPRNPVELQLVQIWEDILDIRPIGVRDNFFDLGGHSLLAVRLMAQIQERFHQNIPLVALFRGATVEQLAGLLSQQSDSLSQTALVEIQPAGSRLPFFCVHPADGSVLSYVHLARYLGPAQPFYGLQVPGPDASPPVESRIEDMAAHYITALRTIQLQGPYLLGGWSLGGVIAFEMAQQLHQQGQEVALLALLDSWLPTPDQRPAKNDEADPRLLIEFLADLRGRFAPDMPGPPVDFNQLNLELQLDAILEQAQMLETVIPEGGLPHLQQLLQVFKANVQAAERYIPQPYAGRGQIVLFQAGEAFPTDPAAQKPRPDEISGWQTFSTQPIIVHQVPGNHYTMLTEPQVEVLAQQLSACLEQAVPTQKEKG